AVPRLDEQTGDIVSAEVYITGSIAGDLLRRQIVLYLTALHEIGHALGLPHTNDFGTIMYRFQRPDDGWRYFEVYRSKLSAGEVGAAPATGLSAADIAALRELYDR